MMSPLHCFAESVKADPYVISLLLDSGKWFIYIYNYEYYISYIPWLYIIGATLEDSLPNGDTALHIAVKLDNRETAFILLHFGADLGAPNIFGTVTSVFIDI